ncbi:hypothetical protein AOQ84DRAFT_411041 [Glonium stellatum]|uniref:Uncharacterized protein n=1 Tax=Glonium stellatum TaxID=574774 RepID=A0A8E2JYK8_9PEZI|nr:hypothetical protein AOQ84DRAFT_411041 [Glonium stellatum]
MLITIMNFPSLSLLLMSSTAFAVHGNEKRQDMASLSALMASWSKELPTVTKSISLPNVVPTRLGNVDPPPSSLMAAIMTGVPASVLVQLISPSGRSSIAAEFKAGATPSWYQALPSPVKSYIISIQAAIATGGNAYTGTELALAIPLTTTGFVGTVTGANAPTSTKSKGIGAHPTAAFAASLSGALGILGLAIAL